MSPRKNWDRGDGDEPLPPLPPPAGTPAKFERPPGDPAVMDDKWYQRSAFWQMLVAMLGFAIIIFPQFSTEINAAIALITQVGGFWIIHRNTYSPNAKDFVRKGGKMETPSGEPISKADVLGKNAT